MAELKFNGANEEAMDDYSVVPASTYNAQVTKSEVVPNKKKDGSLLKLQFKIIDGEFKGRIIFSQYNITNPNQAAVEISRRQIKTLCDALGKPNGFNDTNELHNIPLQIKVSVQPAQAPYPEQNKIKFYDKYSGEDLPKTAEGSDAKTSKPDWA